jgi:UrcA family protein
MQKINCCLLALALSGCVAGAPQDSAYSPDVPTRIVRYADLNLNAADGARVLFRRIKFAAAEVCEPLNGRALAQHVIWQKCYERALADAVSQVNQPRVTALYRGVANRG